MPIYYGTPQFPPGSRPFGSDTANQNSPFWDRFGSVAKKGLPYTPFLLPGKLLMDTFSPNRTSNATGPGFRNALMNVIRQPLGQAGAGLGLNRPPSIEDIMARLEELQNPGRYKPSMELLEAQARAMSGAQYDPVIARLRNQMGLAEGRANRNKEALGAMFNQLSGNLAGEIPGIQQQYAGAEQRSAQQYAGLKQSINDQYAQSQADQEAMMKRLNIEAAAPDALKQQGIDRDFFANQAAQQGQVQQDALGQEERGAVEYTRKGSQMAQVEGTNRQADLMFQLQDLLAQYEGQIGEAEIGKNQSYLATLTGLQNDSQKQAMDQAQRDFENYIKVINLGQSLSKAGQGALSVQSPADVASRVMGMGVSPQGAQNVQSVFMSALSSDPLIQTGVSEIGGYTLPKEALAARVMEAGRNAGLSSDELNALQVAALEYFGRR